VKFPKPEKPKKRGKTAEEKAHLNWIASLPCSIEGCPNPVNVHHIREFGEQRDDFKTIPLCFDHHQGKSGIHFLGKHAWREIYGHELDILKKIQSME
jgi:hypothetical protein